MGTRLTVAVILALTVYLGLLINPMGMIELLTKVGMAFCIAALTLFLVVMIFGDRIANWIDERLRIRRPPDGSPFPARPRHRPR